MLESGIKIYGDGTTAQIARNTVDSVFYGMSVTLTGGAIRNNVVRHGRRLLTFRSVGIKLSGGQDVEVNGNTVRGFHYGTHADGGAANHDIHDNDFRGNRVTDCFDETSGAGTAGTANVWTNDLGITDSPNGLCSPP